MHRAAFLYHSISTRHKNTWCPKCVTEITASMEKKKKNLYKTSHKSYILVYGAWTATSWGYPKV